MILCGAARMKVDRQGKKGKNSTLTNPCSQGCIKNRIKKRGINEKKQEHRNI
jgi:hypothetical protein